MKKEISFRTLATAEGVGGAEGRCRCNVIHTDIMSSEDMAREMSETMRMDVVEARHCMDAVCSYIVRSLARGRKLNFGKFSLSLSIRGTVDGADGEFVPGENEVRVNIQAGAELREALGKMRPINATAQEEKREKPRITSVIDTATGAENTVTAGEKVLIAGSGLLMDTVPETAPDEGVWLEAGGVKVTKGRVLASGSTTLDCVFDGAAGLEPGEYQLAVYTRNGDPLRPAPSKARRRVVLRVGAGATPQSS